MTNHVKSGRVLNSVNNAYADRCVDFFVRPDGNYGYKVFRRDPEDQGAWFVIAFDATGVYLRYEDAVASARLAPVLPDLPAGVEAVRRGDRLFLLNWSNSPVTVHGEELPALGAAIVRDRGRS